MTDKNRKKLRFTDFDREWEILKLGDVIDIASASRVHKNEWTTEGVRFFRSSDVTAKFFGKANVPAYISLELYENLSKRSGAVKKGDILITGGGTIGIPYLINDDQPIYFKDADLIWLKSHNIIDGYFLYTYFTSQFLREYIASISHIGTISHYTIEQAKATPIKLPKLEEQKKIGSFFKSLDDTISFHQQELEILKQTKQGFLQKMFPRAGESIPEVRFPGFKKEWTNYKIADISKVTMGQSPSGKNYTSNPNDHILVQGNADLKKGYVHPRVWTTQVTKTANPGDIILCVRAPVGDVAKTSHEVVLGRGVASLEGDEFLYHLLYKMKSEGYWTRFSTGSTFESINSTDIKDAVVMIPCKDEQNKIGEFFRQLDEVIELKEKELEALKKTKKGFLQKMFV